MCFNHLTVKCNTHELSNEGERAPCTLGGLVDYNVQLNVDSAQETVSLITKEGKIAEYQPVSDIGAAPCVEVTPSNEARVRP